MESDGDLELLPSSPVVHGRKLKRLKKATTVPEYPSPPTFPTEESEIHKPAEEELNVRSGPEPESESFGEGDVVVEENCLGARRVLEFDSLADEVEVTVMEEKGEEIGDLMKSHELERKRLSIDVVPENEEHKKKKKKKRIDDDGGDGSEKKNPNPKESTSSKRKSEKERRENLNQLRAESQRLLRESRDASFKPIALVQKPISSVLDKIRKRKLEILKKFSASFDDDNDSNLVDDGSERPVLREDITDKVEKSEQEETLASCPAGASNDSNTSHSVGSDEAADSPSPESIPSPVAMASESERAFRAPIDDTQELFSDSQISDTKEEAVNEKLDSPPEQVFAPSMLSMNLELDSAPPDDDVSSDEEDNDKENIAPPLSGSVGLTSPPTGDPVKAFVDEEAEEEDDSDNDLQCFQDNEEEGEDDIEELNDMIATQFEEKPIDRERRDQLHQQWLEQQDMAGMDNLLQKLNCGSKLKEPISIEEEEEESKETEYESDDEDEDHIAPSEAAKINLQKAKKMLPQMFSHKEDAYVSSDDEEAEERLTKERLFYKAEKKSTFFSPAEDESSKEVFSLIKKLNIVPDPKRKGRPPTMFDMPRIGQSINISSKSSFVGRASNHFIPSSKKQGSSKGRAYIFGRDDSNSRTSVSISDDSSDAIQRESQPPKAASAKFQKNTLNKYTTLSSASTKSSVSLFEILRKSSLHTERCVQNDRVQQKESIFDAFKLAKKPIKTDERV